MDRKTLQSYLEEIDANLTEDVILYIYGSGAHILLGEHMRTSLVLDVAGPYCSGHLQDFREAAESAGLPVNPESDYQDDHIEWMGGPSSMFTRTFTAIRYGSMAGQSPCGQDRESRPTYRQQTHPVRRFGSIRHSLSRAEHGHNIQ